MTFIIFMVRLNLSNRKKGNYMASGNYIDKNKIKRLQEIYRTSDLDFEDISERFGISLKDASKYCINIKKEFKTITPSRRVEHDFYTPEELELYRAFQSKEPDAFDSCSLNIPLVLSL